MQPSVEHYLKSEFPHIKARLSTRARRFSLRFDALQNALVLNIPPHANLLRLQQFLKDSSTWMSNILKNNISKPAHPHNHIYLLGTPLRVMYEEKKITHVWQTQEVLHFSSPQHKKTQCIEAWFRRTAHQHFISLATQLAEKIGVSIKKLVIKDTRSRWGSCSHQGVISLSWRLLLAPPEVAYYVCAHEIAHLKEMNHGTAFWELVGHLDPHYRQSLLWLKKNGASLFYFNADNL